MVLEEDYWREIEDIEKRYFTLISNFDMSYPKPLNLQQEKRRFFSAIADDEVYNPQFVYEKKHFDDSLIEKLENFKINPSGDLYNIKKLYFDRIKTKLYEIYSHKSWGREESGYWEIKSKGKPSRFLLAKAKLFCKTYKREKVRFTRVSAKVAGKELKEEVFRLCSENVRIIFKDMASKVSINPSSKTITLNPNERFTTLDIKRLKVHEIGVHYLRYFNGKKSCLRILESGTSNYIEIEEGLAVYMEEISGVSSRAQMFIYAGRVIATFYALRCSFYEVYQILRDYGFKRQDAFAITFRAKRNMMDTSLKGGFTKDYVYFSGYLKVKKYARFHKIDNLFIGKVKISDLKILKKYLKEKKFEITCPRK